MSVFSLTASNDSDPWVDIYEEAENLCTLSGVHETLTANVLADHYNHDQRRWKDWPTGTYTPRFKSFQRIASFCSDSRSPTLLHVHRTLAREDSGPPRLEWPTDAERRVLLCSICENFKSITELIPLAFHARQFLTRWMFLKSIYGVLLSYTHVVFVRFDRSGVILSQAIDLHEEPELLLRSIMGCTSLIEQSLDTSVSTANGQAILSRPSPPGEMTSYIVEESIHQNHVLRGSGTRVLSVFKSDKPETKLVFKDWWRDQNGIDESEVMIAVSGLFGLPHYVSHWAVCEPDGEVQTTDFLDKDLKPAPNFVDEDDIVRYSNQPDSEDVDPDADEVKTASSSLNRESRIHCRMLSRDRGHHLLQFRNTPRVVLTAIHDAILGHWSLYKAGYLHHDVSYGNILVLSTPVPAIEFRNHVSLPVPALNDQCTAILNDFDTAAPLSDLRNKPRNPTLTPRGTAVYMSSALLRGCPNLRGQSMVHDDLESFLWVLIVTALWIEDPSPSSEEYDKWVNSAEWAMKTTLFPVIGIPSTSWLSEQKRALLFSFSGKGNPYNSFAPYDPVSRLYSRVIEPWSDYMFRRDLEGMTSKNQTPTDEQYYLAILEILRNGIKSFS